MTRASVIKRSKINGKVSTKLVDKTLRNKLYVDLKPPYNICRKGKEPLILKPVVTIDPVTIWFEVTQCDDKKAMTIADLVDTMWLSRYPWPPDITYDRGREFLGYQLKTP